MTRNKLWFIAGALLILAIVVQSSPAGEVREIELNDGSVILGEVLSLSNGIYTVKSGNLGTVQIEEPKIRAIRPRNATRSNASTEAGSLTDKMMSDKEIMGMIQGLQDDQDFKAILADPEIMQAIINNDFATLLSKPEFLKLMEKPSVRNIQEKIK